MLVPSGINDIFSMLIPPDISDIAIFYRQCFDGVPGYTLQDIVYCFAYLKSKDKSLSFLTNSFKWALIRFGSFLRMGLAVFKPGILSFLLHLQVEIYFCFCYNGQCEKSGGPNLARRGNEVLCLYREKPKEM